MKAFAAGSAEQELLFQVVAGVLQGCPASGSLFVLCLDPLLRAAVQLEQFGQGLEVTACADDVGVSVSKVEF